MIKRKHGFTITELMVVVLILSIIMAGIYLMMLTGQTTWQNTATDTELQEDLRLVIEKVSQELTRSGSDSDGTMKVTIGNGTGVSGTDLLTFSVPVICETGTGLIDANGDVAYWGAPLTWGCTDSSCMDADDDCSTVDYSAVRYLLSANNELLRRVLNPANAVVREDIIAQNVSDFQASLSADQNIVTLTLSVSTETDLNRTMSTTSSVDVYLRNRG